MIVTPLSLTSFFLLINSTNGFQIGSSTITTTTNIRSTNHKYNAKEQQHEHRHSLLFASTTMDGNIGSLPPSVVGKSSSSQSTSSSSSSSPQHSMDTDELKVGVLLLNLGGPEKTDDVEGKLCSYNSNHRALQWCMVATFDNECLFYHNIVNLKSFNIPFFILLIFFKMWNNATWKTSYPTGIIDIFTTHHHPSWYVHTLSIHVLTIHSK